jgi:hypothetical protein
LSAQQRSFGVTGGSFSGNFRGASLSFDLLQRRKGEYDSDEPRNDQHQICRPCDSIMQLPRHRRWSRDTDHDARLLVFARAAIAVSLGG